jgi:hypothetical protein
MKLIVKLQTKSCLGRVTARVNINVVLILLVIFAFTENSPADEQTQIQEQMEQGGFEMIDLRQEYVPLAHNSAGAINAELSAKAIREQLAKVLGVEETVVAKPEFRVTLTERSSGSDFLEKHPEERIHWKAQFTRRELWAKRNGIPEGLFEKLSDKIGGYVRARLAGHTPEYANDLITSVSGSASHQPATLRGKILAESPGAVSKWLQETTNTFLITWYRPPKGANPHVILPPDKCEPVSVEYHVFKIVDGLVTWEYHVAQNEPDVDVRKHDSQEDDPQKAKLITEARKEVDQILENKGIKGQLGSCYVFWTELKKLLKAKYSIDWLSPEDLNPNIHYD